MTEHIALHCFCFRELIKDGRITLHFIPTGNKLENC